MFVLGYDGVAALYANFCHISTGPPPSHFPLHCYVHAGNTGVSTMTYTNLFAAVLIFARHQIFACILAYLGIFRIGKIYMRSKIKHNLTPKLVKLKRLPHLCLEGRNREQRRRKYLVFPGV